MRYRIRVSRVQIAERAVRAKDEDAAIAKVQEELERPYGFLGRWETQTTDIEVLAAEPSVGSVPTVPGEGPLLLSVKDAAEHLGVSRNSLYELLNAGELEYVRIGRRRLIAREALRKFIEVNTRVGYEGRPTT